MQITREQFNSAYKKVPYPIRECIASEELGTIVLSVGKTHNLHVDTIGALERETTNMLLGLINPEQFVAELKSAGIPQESIPNIVAELNTKIFVPLRERMRNPSPEDAEETGTEETAVPPTPAAPAIAAIARMPATHAPVPTATVTPSVVTPIAQPTQRPTPIITPAAPITSPPPLPPQSSVSQFSPSSMPMQTTPLPKPRIQPQQTQNRDDLHAVLKEYGIDPYREPPE